ncbi:alpha/beta fold hydrolase [Nocardia sp. BMG111209]|uniref:alpha/beta fold hydrolase n=1 Tax=Nocardia sp. BMG111209 TaxID=1160137 RepID=UPI000373D03B|nr:alpha/beta hydrolase [Nocardia sp. BMG111209]
MIDEHPSPVATRALADLVDAVQQLAGLTGQVGPFALPADTCDRASDLIAAVCRESQVPLRFDASTRTDFAAVALAAEIRRTQRAPELAGLTAADAAAAARQRATDEQAEFRTHAVPRPDGTVVSAVEAGPHDGLAVVLSAPCAIGYRLSLPWLRALRPAYRCIVVQTRGTTEFITEPELFDRRGYDVADQVADVLAVTEHLGTGPVHLMGLCGGAAVALATAAQHPDRVASLSLWYADLELGSAAAKSEHQVNLRAMLDVAAESRDTAAWIRDRLTSGPMTGIPERIGPLVAKPYATPELFYRYAKLTGATMHHDSRAAVATIRQPCLVATSADDELAHPAGSRWVADTVPRARLMIADHGHHLDAFRATPDQVAALTTVLNA